MAKWIDEIANAEQTKQAMADAREQEAIAAGLKVSAEAPEYWRQLVIELREVARGLSEKPNLHISASVSDNSEPEVENRVRVQVLMTTTMPDSTYTDLLHRIDQHFIRCHTPGGTAYNLRFAVRRDSNAIGVYAENGRGEILTPAQAARYIVEPMVRQYL